MTPNAPRRWVRRAMLSALAGGGLTAVGLGGALPGGALGAEATVGTSGSGGGETPPPATGTTTAPAPAQGGAGEPTTTTSTATSTTETTTSAPPPQTTTSAPPPPPQAAPAARAPAAQAPVVVVQRKQPAIPRRRGAKAGGRRGVKGNANDNVKANGGVGAGGKSNANGSGPTTVPAGTPNGVAPPPLAVAGQAGTLASILGQSAVSAQALQYYRVPLFLLPIYQAAGIQYGVPWQILAAINEVETDYGNDLSVSTAGAVGWMQFMPTTWLQYGVDALGAGYADPYNPVDAIFAAARYLHAAGASSNLHTAILAYNHSEAYVSSVLLRAKLIASYPQSVIATLTGLTEGSLPVAGARVAQDPATPLSVASATAGAVPLEPYAGANPVAPSAANPVAPSPSPPPAPGVVGARAARKHVEELRFVDLLGPLGAPVTAVQDGRIVKLGRSHRLGNYLALQDVYGDVFTYAGLGSIAHRYHEPGRPARIKPAVAAAAAQPVASEPTPSVPASAGRQLPITLHVKAPAQPRLDQQSPEVEAESQQSPEEGAPPPGMGRVRLYAHPGNPVARVAAAQAGAQGAQSDGHGGKWLPLRQGSLVSQGTILGHLSKTPVQDAQAGSPLQAFGGVHVSVPSTTLRFAIRPAGDSSTVDPRPILANWRQLDTALHPRGARSDVNLLGATVAQVFLMSQSELERTVLSDPGISIYECGRQDIAAGSIDGRVLAVLEFLSRSGLKPTVSALRCGHSEMTTSGNVSEHYFGDAVDISAINGVPIAGHQGAGSIADVTIRALLTLQGQFVPHQIISLMKYPEAPNTLALPEHWNHIHVGFRPQPGTLAPSAGPGAAVQAIATAAHSAGPGQTAPSPLLAVSGDLSAAQWNQLVERIGALQQPAVAAKPTAAAIRDPQAAAGNRDLGARALPRSGAEE